MAGYIAEFFGYNAEDHSTVAMMTAAKKQCPFTGLSCSKIMARDKLISGVCAVRQKTEGSPKVICCPIRLYADNYKILHLISKDAFKADLNLYAGRTAVEKAKLESGAVAVFGKGWGGELRLPQRKGYGSYPVHKRVIDRLGGKEKLPAFPSQPASIHFVAYDTNGNEADGKISGLDIIEQHCTTVYKVQEAFSSLNLPDGNVYKDAICRSLYPERFK